VVAFNNADQQRELHIPGDTPAQKAWQLHWLFGEAKVSWLERAPRYFAGTISFDFFL